MMVVNCIARGRVAESEICGTCTVLSLRFRGKRVVSLGS